jgi:hypothetical protein
MCFACWITKVTHTHTHTFSLTHSLTHTLIHSCSLSLRLCYTNCSSAATMVSRKRFSVTLYVHCLSCFLYGHFLGCFLYRSKIYTYRRKAALCVCVCVCVCVCLSVCLSVSLNNFRKEEWIFTEKCMDFTSLYFTLFLCFYSSLFKTNCKTWSETAVPLTVNL